MDSDKKFEENRQQLLLKLSKMRRDNTVKRKVDQIKVKASAGATAAATPSRKVSKKTVVAFGVKGLFMNSMLQMLQATCTVFHFADSEKALEFIMDNSVTHIILDMDLPTDWKAATDIFSSAMTIAPQTLFLVCSMEPNSVQVQVLVAQGAMVAAKPLASDELFRFLDGAPN
jgi:hypothetical protein